MNAMYKNTTKQKQKKKKKKRSEYSTNIPKVNLQVAR